MWTTIAAWKPFDDIILFVEFEGSHAVLRFAWVSFAL
jgi:hypothetical protein